MGKVSLLDVAPTAQPTDTAVASGAASAGVGGAGSRFSILTNPDQIRLLYMISKYSAPARKVGDEELCMRFLPLAVLVYEAIVDTVLDYDYAPSLRACGYNGISKNVWVNVSQEMIAALEDFIFKGLVANVKLQSRDFTTVNAYQVTEKGLNFLARAPKEITIKVDDFLYRGGDVLQVRFTGEVFEIYTASGYNQTSGITEIEDLSYVSSPWLPKSMRFNDKPLRSMAHRAYEAGQGLDMLNSDMSSLIFCRNVSVMLAEWIPMGPNQLSYLMDRLGVLGRCSGGLFTAQVDLDPDKTRFTCVAGLTQVRILDYSITEAVNFEAEIQFAEAEDIVQVEYFAINVAVDGSITMGLNIEAIAAASADRIALDSLSRLCVDVINDSSRITADFLSEYQTNQVTTVYNGQEATREKYCMFLADSMDPLVKAESYINDAGYLAELRQVLGDVHSVHCLSPEDIIVMGSKGTLAAGPRCRLLEELLVRFLTLMARENFINVLFNRIKLLNSELVHIRELLACVQNHPTRPFAIRDLLAKAASHISLLHELQEYLSVSLLGFRVPPLPSELSGRKLFSFLDLHKRLQDLLVRADNMKSLLKGAGNEHITLSKMIDAVSKASLEDVAFATTLNTAALVSDSVVNAINSQALDVINLIMAGSFLFAMISVAVGGMQNWANQNYIQMWLVYLDTFPLAVFSIHVALFMVFAYVLTMFLATLSDSADGWISWRVRMNRKVDPKALFAWLTTKPVSTISVELDNTLPRPQKVRSVAWDEEEHKRWKGPAPKVEVTYDHTNGFLLQVNFQLHLARSSLTQAELISLFQDDLISNRIMEASHRLLLPEFETTDDID